MKKILLPLAIGCGIAAAAAAGGVLNIHNANELIAFMNDVATEGKYTGSTVYLENDIEFTWEQSRQFRPIGEDYAHNFVGTFDGRGHSISNLTMDPTLNYGGLFGYSRGITIRNVVIGKDCRVLDTAAYSSSNYYLGSVLGRCDGEAAGCVVEGCVNMMDIVFNGDVDHATGMYIKVFMGGIVGGMAAYPYEAVVRGCVNYGAVMRSVEYHSDGLYMGGIIGGDNYANGPIGSVENCVNNGAVVFNGVVPGRTSFSVGGISGREKLYKARNCTNIGVVSGASSVRVWGLLGLLFVALVM